MIIIILKTLENMKSLNWEKVAQIFTHFNVLVNFTTEIFIIK